MPTFVNGLPLHPLLVHAVVVLVPLTVLGAIVVAVWPVARRRYGTLVVACGAVALVFDILAEQAGEGLEHNLPRTAAIAAHAAQGDGLKVFVAGLLVAVAAFVFLHARAERTARREGPGTTTAPSATGLNRLVATGLAVLVVVLAGATAWKCYEVGDSGAKAVWGGITYQPQPRGAFGHRDGG